MGLAAGVELGGALKNVLAIACGISDGLGFGNNGRAALITRGLVEMTRLAVAAGAHPLTMSGLAGVGDLVLTCTGAFTSCARNQIRSDQPPPPPPTHPPFPRICFSTSAMVLQCLGEVSGGHCPNGTADVMCRSTPMCYGNVFIAGLQASKSLPQGVPHSPKLLRSRSAQALPSLGAPSM